MNNEEWSEDKEKAFHKLTVQTLVEYDQVIAMLDELLDSQAELQDDDTSFDYVDNVLTEAKAYIFTILLYCNAEFTRAMLIAVRKLVERSLKDSEDNDE